MSYLYGFDVIKCLCDVMHTDCDVLHRVCLMSYREFVWYNWCTGLNDTDRVDVVSDIEGVMSRNNACDVIKLWCVLIKHGCDALYRYMILYIKWVCFHTYKGCDIIERVGVMTQIQWLSCHIHWIWFREF